MPSAGKSRRGSSGCELSCSVLAPEFESAESLNLRLQHARVYALSAQGWVSRGSLLEWSLAMTS